MPATAQIRNSNTQLDAAMRWLRSMYTSPDYTTRDRFNALLVRVAVLDPREPVQQPIRKWLRALSGQGDELRREWAARLMKELEGR